MTEPTSYEMPNLIELKRKGEFGEYMLASWGYVEGLVDLFVWDAFHLPFEDAISDLFLDLLGEVRFEWKIQTLKRLKTITKDEFNAIHALQQSRNRLFHFSGEQYANLFGDIKERERLMKEAKEATNTCFLVLFRTHPDLVKQFQGQKDTNNRNATEGSA